MKIRGVNGFPLLLQSFEYLYIGLIFLSTCCGHLMCWISLESAFWLELAIDVKHAVFAVYTRLSISENSCDHSPPPDVTGCRNDTRQAESTAHQQPLLPLTPDTTPLEFNNHLSYAGFAHYHVKNLRNLQFHFSTNPCPSAVDQSTLEWPLANPMREGCANFNPLDSGQYLRVTVDEWTCRSQQKMFVQDNISCLGMASTKLPGFPNS